MKEKHDTVPGSTDGFSGTKIMVLTLVSTSVRVFVPILGLFAIGAAIDFSMDYKPYGMIIGIALGIITATILVIVQLRSIDRDKK